MRIVRFLLTSFIVIAILGSIGGLIAREVLLFYGVSTVRASMSTLREAAANSGSYQLECQKKGVSRDVSNSVERIQLRFTSPSEYVLEAVCNQFLLDPIIITRDTLPMFVTKTSPSSGFVWDDTLHVVTISVWGRSRSIILENFAVRYTSAPVTINPGLGPVTSCSGYGYSCCMTESSVGEGTVLSQANDCPRTCYASCISRPVLLSFVSEPFFDPKTRNVSIQNGGMVNFSFVLDKGMADKVTATLDFGDGTSQTFNESTTTASHVYNCAQNTCQFTAQLKVSDSASTPAADTPVSRILVTVTR
ncbi:MAG: hypothetical protein M3Q81_01780 [bacterium]|nr:hypothetical protein [bacterium]